MTAPDHLAAIEARADKVAGWRKHFIPPQSSIDFSQRDVPALLAMVREQRAALDRVEALHVEDEQGKCAECTVAPFSMHSVRYPCPTIAAIIGEGK